MKKIEKHIKKQRNDTDTQVKKYKQDLDAIGIRYDHKSGHVEVPNHATGGFEYFKWDWMTSTTGSHSEIVRIFKKIVRTLKETKNNPAQYENLVSNLDASTKNALNNITPTQQASQEELVEKALVEAERGTKVNDVTAEFKDHFSKLNPDGVVAFMHRTKRTEINVDGCVGTALLDNELNIKYPAIWNGISTKEFFKKNEIQNKYASFENKIEPSVQYADQIESNLNKENYLDLSDAESDIEIISKLLEPEVMLTNGKKIEVKKIIDAIYKPKDSDFYLKKLNPETNQLVKKEIALKLAYDLYNDSKELSEVSSISEALGINEEFNNYSDFSLAQLQDEEVNITGGEYSYLE